MPGYPSGSGPGAVYCVVFNVCARIAFPCAPPNTVTNVAVPEQVAVPLVSVAEVGAAVAPYPVFVTAKVAPVQLPDVTKLTVTAPFVRPSLNDPSVQVPTPLIEPPLPEVTEPSPAATYATHIISGWLPLTIIGLKYVELVSSETIPAKEDFSVVINCVAEGATTLQSTSPGYPAPLTSKPPEFALTYKFV